MDFVAVVDQAIALLRQRGRLTYRTLQLQFQLDDTHLEALTDEIIKGQRLAADEDGAVLVWIGDADVPPALAVAPAPPLPPLTYTPHYLAEKILTSRSALEGERKQVTVLFADLKGSMELLADRAPEEARQLLDPVLERMMEAVHRYEGTVNLVMGDGIMALFGAPVAHEDHAVRACYATLAMQHAVGHYAEVVRRQQGLDVLMRIGLHSGEVVVRTIGNDLHMDYTAVGQTTHLAARMEQLARPGTALLTADTLRLVEGYVEVTPLGPVPVKGLQEPVAVYELLRAGPVRSRLQAAVARGLTRFVGRDAEVEHLRQALARAGAGQGQVVAGVGEAGVGKSRLFYEFTRSHHAHGWLLLASHSVSYGKATAYLPILDLLKGYFQIAPQDDARRRREKVTGKLLTLDRALEPMLPTLLALLEVPVDDPQWHTFDPPQRRRLTLEAIKHLLLRESQVQPLCLVFEDLHWIDAETQALLDSLVESLPTARLLLLVNYRPEYQHGWGSKTYYTQLRLDPLPPVSAEAFLQALLGDDLSLTPLKHLLIARTQGNPFFLEESVLTLVETGVLVGDRGASRLAKPMESLQVPATVQAVLAARIDRLPPAEKRLLQTAAVIGTEVSFALVQAIGELSEEELRRALGHLQAAEFLYETRLFPEPEYTFKHALTHEVAYGSLLLERRRGLHARLVAALESLTPEQVAEQVDRLAHHALRGEVWAKAVTYCQQAGARAWDRTAFREAVAAFEQALQALAHLPEDGDTRVLAIEIRLALRGPLSALSEHERLLALFVEAEALARALDDQARLGRVLTGLVFVRRLMGDYDGAIAAGQQALDLAAALGHHAIQVHAAYDLGQVYAAIGDFGRAVELQRWSVEAADRASGMFSPNLRSLFQARLARTLSNLGAFVEGRRYGEEALRLATLAGRGQTLVVALGSLSELYLVQGDLAHALPVLEQGLTVCRASGDVTWWGGIAVDLGAVYTLQGRVAEGRALLEEAANTGLPHGVRRAAYWVQRSEVCRLAGRDAEAWQHAHEALDLARQRQERGNEALALHQLGALHAHAVPPEVAQAHAHYQEALTLADELGMRPLLAHCHRGLGALYAKTGRQEQARAALATAIELYRAMDMVFWLPQAEAALAQVEGQ